MNDLCIMHICEGEYMRIGLAPYRFINNDVEYNLSQIKKALMDSKGKVDLLCFGETFLQGFDSLTWRYDSDKDVAITVDSEVMDLLRAWSVEFDTAILLGYIEREEDTLYSSCAVLSKGTMIFNYRRISTGWKESSLCDEHYGEGEAVNSFKLGGKDLSIALCGDLWEYPDKFKTDGLLIWPVYINFGLDDWANEESEYAEHAATVAKDVVMINSISDAPVSHGGAFYFKEGKTVVRTGFDSEEVMIIDL